MTTRTIKCLLELSDEAFLQKAQTTPTPEEIEAELRERELHDKLVSKRVKRFLAMCFPKAHVSLGPLSPQEQLFVQTKEEQQPNDDF